MFNWLTFFQKYNIEFVEKGPNVSRGNLNLSCPFCGSDPSHHMGVNLRKSYWGCWRDSTHRGRRPHKLIMALLNCSYTEAMAIVGDDDGVNLTNFDKTIANLKGVDTKKSKSPGKLKFPPEIKPITSKGFGNRFKNYLVNKRGFPKKRVKQLIKDYNLHYSLVGEFKNRIIIPIYMDGQLVGWTGRSIQKDNPIRYKSLSHREEFTSESCRALVNIKHTVYNYSTLFDAGGKILYINEGPFDAFKLDFFGKKYSMRATCLFSTSLSEEQIYLISELASRFDRVILMFDEGQVNTRYSALNDLHHIGLELGTLPPGVDDPGELTEKMIDKIALKNQL